MSDTQALIEEARRDGHGFDGPKLLHRLADALEAAEATRAALDDENLRLREQAGEMAEEIERLRGLVSGDKKEQR